MSAAATDSNTSAPLSLIERILTHFDGVRRSGPGFLARCTHHDDRHASLSLREADDGRVLLHCHRGCATVDVLQSAGLAWIDLFPPGHRERLRPRVWRGTIPMAPHGRPAFESFGDCVGAALLGELARLAHVRGTLDNTIALALQRVGAAIGATKEALREAVDAALANEAAS